MGSHYFDKTLLDILNLDNDKPYTLSYLTKIIWDNCDSFTTNDSVRLVSIKLESIIDQYNITKYEIKSKILLKYIIDKPKDILYINKIPINKLQKLHVDTYYI